MSGPTEPAERRHNDRRRVDRRRDSAEFSATLTEESLFEAMGSGLDGAAPAAQAPDSRSERSDQADWGATSLPADSPYLARQARRIVGAGESGFERMYRIFVGARAALGLALLGAQIVGLAVGTRTLTGGLISLAYAVQALTLWILPRFRRRTAGAPAPTRLSRRQWVATIGIDLLAFSALHLLAPSTTFNYTPLLVLPALMAGVLTPRMPSMAAAAAASLMLLVAAWRASLGGADVTSAMLPAGLTGIGLFVITLLAGELAARLAREEQTARGSLELARQQAQLNRLVIEEMADGVLVVDRRARVRAANPAARRLLAPHGMGPPAPFQLQDQAAWRELAERVTSAFETLAWPEAARDVQLPFQAGHSRSLRLRARFTRPRSGGGGAGREVFCVLFLEDLRSVQARNRQEKLAAMGRVSAGIAHEIRNPLAAIAQANALLREEAGNAEQQMLTAMVADNVERLKRIVDDVMEVAPGGGVNPRPIDLGAEVGRIVADWARTSQVVLGTGSRLRVELPHEPLPVVFDAEHLRRVLVNLLDNARRYASDRPGAIDLVAERQGGAQARLSVVSDGDPIPPDIEPFLFEPFFSTRSRGTGLGLYICRELCERYGGSIDYWQHPADAPHRNEFVVMMRVAAALAPNQDRLLP
ncbi:MAG TPA: ATP-binding protein [Burkholderiaceae bacterium]|nr:ATP-binding protein [Burkholderiaceae bacterium]